LALCYFACGHRPSSQSDAAYLTIVGTLLQSHSIFIHRRGVRWRTSRCQTY